MPDRPLPAAARYGGRHAWLQALRSQVWLAPRLGRRGWNATGCSRSGQTGSAVAGVPVATAASVGAAAVAGRDVRAVGAAGRGGVRVVPPDRSAAAGVVAGVRVRCGHRDRTRDGVRRGDIEIDIPQGGTT